MTNGRRLVAAAVLTALAGVGAWEAFAPPPERGPVVVADYPGRSADDAFARVAAGYEPVREIFETKCYDCHTTDVMNRRLPLAASLPVVADLVQDDINRGVGALDLSAGFPFGHRQDDGDHIVDFDRLEADLRALDRSIAIESMPPSHYVMAHPTRALDAEESAVIDAWLEMAHVELGMTRSSGDVTPEGIAGLLMDRCGRCHGTSGPGVSNVGDLAGLAEAGAVVPGAPSESILFTVVESGRMPPDGEPGLSTAEIRRLEEWIRAGAEAGESPKPNPVITASTMHDHIREDLDAMPSVDRADVRYLTLTHLWNQGDSPTEMKRYRDAVTIVLNSLSTSRQVARPVTIDPSDTILRVRLADFGLTPDEWARIEVHYPYAIGTPETDSITETHGGLVSTMNADWFAYFTTQPPLYPLLLGLPVRLAALEGQLGIDHCEEIEALNVLRVGVQESVPGHKRNRVVERIATTDGAYWISYDFDDDDGSKNAIDNPLGPAACVETDELVFDHAGGEVIYSLPNGFQGYVLALSNGERLDKDAPTNIVLDVETGGTVVNARSCMGCHRRGIIDLEDATRARSHDREARGILSADSLATIKAVYRDKPDIAHAVATDRDRYMTALVSSGVSPLHDIEPVRALAARFVTRLDKAAVAAELGISQPDLKHQLGAATALAEAQSLLDGIGIPRREFLTVFQPIVEALKLGELQESEAMAFSGADHLERLVGSNQYTNQTFDRIDVAVQFRRAQRACTRGDGAACLEAGTIARRGAYLQGVSNAHALEFALRGCDARNGASCVLAATVLSTTYDDSDAPTDHIRGAELYGLGCEYGHADSCFRLARLMLACEDAQLEGACEPGAGLLEDRVPLYRAACDLGSADGCYRLGGSYKHLGMPNEAIAAWEQAIVVALDGNSSRDDSVYQLAVQSIQLAKSELREMDGRPVD